MLGRSFLLLTLLAFSVASAETRQYALGEIYDIALETNEEIAIQKVRVSEARYALREAYSIVLPKLSFTGRGLRYGDEVAFQDTVIQPRDDWRYDFTLKQPLYSWGRARMTLAQAKNQIRAARSDALRNTQSILISATEKYLNVLKAQDDVRIRADALRLATEHMRVADSLFRAGEVPRTEILRAEIDVLESERELLRAEGALRVARSQLSKICPLARDFAVEEPDLTARIYEPVLETNVEKALAMRPEIRQYQIVRENARLELRKRKRNYFPILAGELAYHEQKEGFVNRYTSASAVLEINFFDGGAREARIAGARVALDEAEEEASLVRKQVALDVEQAFYNLTTLEKTLRKAERAAELARSLHTDTEHRYAVGEATSLDVLDAKNALLSAEIARSSARYDYFLAQCLLSYAIGDFEISRIDKSTGFYYEEF